MFNIGLAEDDFKIAALIKKGLAEEGFLVTVVNNGDEAYSVFSKQAFHLFILDVMLPGLNGIELCGKLKSTVKDTPILLLTALGGIDDKVNGFDAGADDYLVKPFHFRELLARIKGLLKRYDQAQLSNQYHMLVFEDLQLHMDSKEVKRDGQSINLTTKEFELLELFMRHPNKVLSRQYIASQIWNITFDTGTNVIDVYVNFLRKKIEHGFERKFIHTKIGMGYIFK